MELSTESSYSTSSDVICAPAPSKSLFMVNHAMELNIQTMREKVSRTASFMRVERRLLRMSSPEAEAYFVCFLIDSPPEIIQIGKNPAKWIYLINLYYSIKRQTLQGLQVNFHILLQSTQSIICA